MVNPSVGDIVEYKYASLYFIVNVDPISNICTLVKMNSKHKNYMEYHEDNDREVWDNRNMITSIYAKDIKLIRSFEEQNQDSKNLQ